MSDQPQDLSEKPDRRIREGLRCLQMSGAVFLRVVMTAPWAYLSPEEEAVRHMLQAGDRRVVLFHILTEGRCRIALGNGEELDIEAGDVIILPHADRHLVGSPSTERPQLISELLPPLPWDKLPVVVLGGGGEPTGMVCGYLLADDLPFNPVLSSLPRFMRVRPAGGPLARWVEASVEYALHAAAGPSGSDPRLAEMLFTECICHFAAQAPETERGWLAGLADPAVGRALACMHREPEVDWTLQELARRAGASRSVIDERFRQLLGRAPMAYLTAWRLQLASRRLRTTTDTLAEIAGAVGYASEASFSKAFKRQVGVAPSEWRALTPSKAQ